MILVLYILISEFKEESELNTTRNGFDFKIKTDVKFRNLKEER